MFWKRKKEEVTRYAEAEFESFNQPSLGAFAMVIEAVFTITGRGTVATGEILSGQIAVGDKVVINNSLKTTVTGIEMFRKVVTVANVGDKVGLLLKNVTRNDISIGQAIEKE
jgi:elongation factor Tu